MNTGNTKTCVRCNKKRNVNDFQKSTTTDDGLSVYCLDCIQEINEQRTLEKTAREKEPGGPAYKSPEPKSREYKPQKSKTLEGMKFCRDCGKTKPAGDFNKHTGNKDGLQAYCRKCCHDKYLNANKKAGKPTEGKMEKTKRKYTRHAKPEEKSEEQMVDLHVPADVACGLLTGMLKATKQLPEGFKVVLDK